MSKIVSIFQIESGLSSKLLDFMLESNHTIEEQHEYSAKLKFISDTIKEITKDIHSCTCDQCEAWERSDEGAFSADGGYLGYCRLHKYNTQQGDFCSNSLIKNYIEKI